MREMYPETHPLSLLPAMAPLLLALAIYPPAVGCEDDDGGRFSVSFFVFVFFVFLFVVGFGFFIFLLTCPAPPGIYKFRHRAYYRSKIITLIITYSGTGRGVVIGDADGEGVRLRKAARDLLARITLPREKLQQEQDAGRSPMYASAVSREMTGLLADRALPSIHRFPPLSLASAIRSALSDGGSEWDSKEREKHTRFFFLFVFFQK
jgi:hypothetical protein